MKNILISIFSLIMVFNWLTTQAQTSVGTTNSGKITIGIMPFTTKNNYVSQAPVQLLCDNVAKSFASKSHFVVVDRSKMEQINTEKNTQKGADYLNGQIAEQGKSVGAQYIVTGNVTSLVFETHTTPVVNPLTKSFSNVNKYTGEAEFTLSVIDVTTGQTVSVQNFTSNGKKSFSQQNDDALMDAINSSGDQVVQWINSIAAFHLSIVIAQVNEKDPKTGLPAKVLISAGSEMNIQNGSKYNVIEHDTLQVNGTPVPRDQTIGELKVVKVEDSNFSDCKVTKGDAAIQAMLDGKKPYELIIEKY